MAAVVEDLLRLAWRANADGRAGMRDALLTLAVAESGADDAVLAERCRKLLVAHRPDHCFAGPMPIGHALARPKVAETLRKLRFMYPPVRVRHLLLRGGAAGGPYTSPDLPLWRVLEDLAPDRKSAAAVVYGRDLRPEEGGVPPSPFSRHRPPERRPVVRRP